MEKWVKFSVAMILASSILIILPVFYSIQKKKINDALNCDEFTHRPLIVFLVDASDPYDLVDSDRVKKEVRSELLSNVDTIRFVVISPNQKKPYDPIEVSVGCLQPSDILNTDLFLSSKEKEKYNSVYKKSIDNVTNSVDQILKTPLNYSPLMETIISVSKRHDFRSANRSTIIIYSDMEQNSSAYSVYHRKFDLSNTTLEDLSLNDAHIKVHRIVRRTKLGIKEFKKLQALWDSWFSKAGAVTEWSK